MPQSNESERARPRRGRKASYGIEIISEDSEEDTDDKMEAESIDSDDEEMDTDALGSKRRATATAKKGRTRKSSRSNKFTSSMAEPSHSIRDVLAFLPPQSPTKSPARRHAQRRRSLKHTQSEESGDSDSEEELEEEEEEEDGSPEEPLKVQRILASRTETRATWRVICRDMNTSEINYGSRWFQPPDERDDDDKVFEERFLIKWSDLGYLHVSWETQPDLLSQVDGSSTYFTSFFRKSVNGLLFSADERCDGDYFDPAFTQIDRILEVEVPSDFVESGAGVSLDLEDTYGSTSFGMIMDKKDPQFEDGTGRQFLVKWCNSSYSDGTYEFERDLILRDIEYKPKLKDWIKRSQKPSKKKKESMLRRGEREARRLAKIFGDASTLNEKDREKTVQKYQQELQSQVFKNGGQLRDYQAEGVSWMVSNFINDRSSILADEMGLGKTLQTAIFVNKLIKELFVGGPALIVVPLSTLSHWHREFASWTDLNVVTYHGSSADRRLIREQEMAFDGDRPQTGVSFNVLYLKKCGAKKVSKATSPWMIDVLLTTPEMLVADDFMELTAVKWEVLVVDEAHRLKNHTSKLAVNVRDPRFSFGHKLLLTGTPLQNSVEEFWALLNLIDESQYDDLDTFLSNYGDLKDKEHVDQLHEGIRPFILRRLKEDVEKSVPAKSETLIEVELTHQQKTWYRALYEKNIKFLHRNKKKGLDGPGLNNLAMELRKCCNHLFLLNGVEDDFRRENEKAGVLVSEGDFLAKASGKLVLLDKLLPRLKEEGHRVLIFSQFKIMLDILEDYLHARSMNCERIDGSITGNRRQQAIDRFQAPPSEKKEPPFIMMLTTRAGDFNPQNDLQAQARCHRIGQTKTVKVYRLLTRKTYEMQMFHMSSLKMGLDQAVLKGFESNAAGENTMSKDEVEKLLRRGAYDIFNEDQDGTGEGESNDFVQQDIDAILQRRSRTVTHENTGSNSNAAGGTFSKARFVVQSKTPSKAKKEDIDLEDPDFWKKMVGDPEELGAGANEETKPRQRTKMNYSDKAYGQQLDASLLLDSSSESESEDCDAEDPDSPDKIRVRWGGSLPENWRKDDAEKVLKQLMAHGYGIKPWKDFAGSSKLLGVNSTEEVKRMAWSLMLLGMAEVAADDAKASRQRKEKAAARKRESGADFLRGEGGVLAVEGPEPSEVDTHADVEAAFKQVWASAGMWVDQVLRDAVEFAKNSSPRDPKVVEHEYLTEDVRVQEIFDKSLWPSLKSRGWSSVAVDNRAVVYKHGPHSYNSIKDVLAIAEREHQELAGAMSSLSEVLHASRREHTEARQKLRDQDLSLSSTNITVQRLWSFLDSYAPVQLMFAVRSPKKKFRVGRRPLTNSTFLHTACRLVNYVRQNGDPSDELDRLEKLLSTDKRSALPDSLWSSRHDAVLVFAIAKHGWIDHDACCRAITDDKAIVWGPPFEKQLGSSLATALLQACPRLVSTARRAAVLLNNKDEPLEELKCFNWNLVARTYGLTRQNDAEQTPVSHLWTVDEEKLQPKREENAVRDLPTKRDLVKRAKVVLKRDMLHKGAHSESTAKPLDDLAVIDQSDSCNVLLAEILRAILKTPASSPFSKFLLKQAVTEARGLLKETPLLQEDQKDPVSTMQKVLEQVLYIKSNLVKKATPSKNVIRFMLGEDVVKPKKPDDPVFPRISFGISSSKARAQSSSLVRDKQMKSSSASKTEQPPLQIRGTPNSKKASGEAYISLARKRLHDVSQDTSQFETSGVVPLQLTEIETRILSGLCTYGIPTFSREDTSTSSDDYNWSRLGACISQEAQVDLDEAKKKLEDGKRFKCPLQTLMSYESEMSKIEEVASQALEYAEEPETLAKKSIMLVSKMNQMWAQTAAEIKNLTYNGLGSSTVVWMDSEIERWAQRFDLLDHTGQPLGFTAIDFMDEMSTEDSSRIQIASLLDKRGSRQVRSQMAMVSRLRSLPIVFSEREMDQSVKLAVESILSQGLGWNGEPKEWLIKDSSGKLVSWENDSFLLEQISKHGFCDTTVKNVLKKAGIKDTRTLSTLDLQRRSNALVRVIARHCERDDTDKFESPKSTVQASMDCEGVGQKRVAADDVVDLTGSAEKKLRASA